MDAVLTMEEAIALQPAWIGIWLNWLMIGAVFLPLVLFVWRPTRIAALLSVLAAVGSGLAVFFMYEKMGYVKLLGLPHVILWTPLVWYYLTLLRRNTVPTIARYVMYVVLATILISLAFDYADLVRYILGERAPLENTVLSGYVF
jgi:hypothetical protein